jgi:hypothetical protein
MEISSSAVTGAMRVGLQVAAAYKGPHLEVYFELLNLLGPEQEVDLPGFGSGTPSRRHRFRDPDVGVHFQIVNIGGQRAENVRLRQEGSLRRRYADDFGGRFDRAIPQIAPGQVIHLFKIEATELQEAGPDGRVAGLQTGDLIITAEYNSPGGLVNFAKTLWPRLRGRAHHRTEFGFNTKMIEGDLPPVRYS